MSFATSRRDKPAFFLKLNSLFCIHSLPFNYVFSKLTASTLIITVVQIRYTHRQKFLDKILRATYFVVAFQGGIILAPGMLTLPSALKAGGFIYF